MKKALLLTKSKNRMHCIAYLLAAGVLAFCCCCCNRDHSTSTPEELETGELEIEELEPGELDTWKLAHLEGTKWKLAGIVDVKTGVLTELEPKDCERCYTLTFDTDSTASGCSLVSLKIAIDLVDLDKYMLEDIMYIPDDVNIFRLAMVTIESFAIASNELKLYYHDHDKKKYLFFKRIQQ